jgi:filamentous hemagglutinin
MRTIRTIVSGNTVDVQAGQNINVTGSHLVSTEGTTLLAGNDINLVNATDSRYENHYKKVKKS